MLLALSWHTGYQSLYLPEVLPESRAEGTGGMESILSCMGFIQLLLSQGAGSGLQPSFKELGSFGG